MFFQIKIPLSKEKYNKILTKVNLCKFIGIYRSKLLF